MNNKIVNKQISVDQIVEVAKYLERYKEQFQNMFAKERQMNMQMGNTYKQFGETELLYSIQFQDGKNIKENGFNWFVSNLGQPRLISEIIINLRVTFFTKQPNSETYNVLNSINARIDFRESGTKIIRNSDTSIDITTTHQEQEAYRLEQDITNILQSNDDRYNKTIKNKKIRMQSFCISVGLILSYILYLIIRININKMPDVAINFFSNKYVLVIGQWFVAILLGNLFSYWYILSVYRPILPWAKYSGRSAMSNQSVYTDDVNDYTNHSEVQFGQYWDAKKRRDKIEKIFMISKIILLVQAIISVIMFLIIK